MPLVRAQSTLIEKISAASALRARSSSDSELWRGGRLEASSRPCIFPGQDASIGRRLVMLIAGSRGARMSETELGTVLAQHLTPELDDTRLRQLIGQLNRRATEG